MSMQNPETPVPSWPKTFQSLDANTSTRDKVAITVHRIFLVLHLLRAVCPLIPTPRVLHRSRLTTHMVFWKDVVFSKRWIYGLATVSALLLESRCVELTRTTSMDWILEGVVRNTTPHHYFLSYNILIFQRLITAKLSNWKRDAISGSTI